MRWAVPKLLIWAAAFLLAAPAARAQQPAEAPAPAPGAIPTVTIFTDGLADANSRTSQVLRELAIGVDRSKTLRAMPIMGYGGERNARELLQSRGDFSVLNSDILTHLELINAHHGARQKLRAVTSLFPQRIFLFARGGITAFEQLAGKQVAMLGPEATTGITLHTVFGLARVPAGFVWVEGDGPVEADGALALEGDVARWLARLPASAGWRLIPLMPAGALGSTYRAASIALGEAPGLTVGTSPVPTLKLETVLAAADIGEGHPRHADMTKFIEGFLGLLPRLHKRFPGSIWNRLDAEAPVPGWRRLASALDAVPAAMVGQEVTEAPAAAEGLSAPPTSLAMTAVPPLMDEALPQGGVIGDLAAAVLKDAQGSKAGPVALRWSADRQGLIEAAFDAGGQRLALPWLTPACGKDEAPAPHTAAVCDSALLSDGLIEVPYVLLARDGAPATAGSVLCIPADQDLPREQRRWLKTEKLGLARPATLTDCLAMLERREAAAILAGEAEGRSALARFGLAQTVRVSEQPVGRRAVHIALPRTQPGSETVLAQINAAIARLKQSGRHAEIVARHMTELRGE